MIYAIGLDWQTASLEERESCTVPAEQVHALLQGLAALHDVRGCALLQTCNRFELYLEASESLSILALKEQLKLGVDAFVLSRDAACRRLMEVACGLRSQILGEEQILTQVRLAVEVARAAGTTTPELETLFRLAVTAGKAVRSSVRFRAVPPSSAHKAVALAATALGGLTGKRGVVIGNGEMGRLAAGLLVEAGCVVTVTLRSYRHGETVVPKGCETVPYTDRLEKIDGCDVLVSATKSPHFTITAPMLAGLARPPAVVVDMALPRDIAPECRGLDGIHFFDMDDLAEGAPEKDTPELRAAHEIIDTHLAEYTAWLHGRKAYRDKGSKLAVFAGTSEGRRLCEHLAASGAAATAFVATEYGNALMKSMQGITVHAGRMDAQEMQAELAGFDTVVDATHPYATEASSNIKAAAEQNGKLYLRLCRPPTDARPGVITVPDTAVAAATLAETDGNALLTTGSKELAVYTSVPSFAQRLFARVLPDAEVIAHCRALGFAGRQLICMQGPFSHEMNLALLRSTGAKWLVTKDTGVAGGLMEKLSAAEEAGVRVILIARPPEEAKGHSLEQVCEILTGSAPTGAAMPAGRFPLFVSLAGKPCLVVGGGRVGQRRCGVLRQFGAQVTLVSPTCAQPPGGVAWHCRAYLPEDILGKALVVAATDNRQVNHQIAMDCEAEGIPVSVADCPEECSFFFPAVCRSPHLTAGVVSNGEEHGQVRQVAAEIRGILEVRDS